MYTENERRGINWGLVIKRGIIVIAVLLLLFTLAWIISKINGTSNNENINPNSKSGTYESTNNNQETNDGTLESYSKEFIENFKYLQDTGRNYFLVHGPLPKDGHSTTITLDELIMNNLILPFTVNGNACNTEESHIKLTNSNGIYIMSVKLSWGVEEATISEQLGCNQFCEGTKCTEKEVSKPVVNAKPDKPSKPSTGNKAIEYEYKQAYKSVTTTYSCPSGYVKNGTKCYKTNSVNKTPEVKTIYTCPVGYNKNGTKCISTGGTINATPHKVYYCSTGVLSGDQCLVTSTSTKTPTKKTNYKCADSTWTLSGTTCTKKVTSTSTKTASYTKSTSYTCPSGYTKSGSGTATKCYKNTTSSGKKYFSSYPTNISKSCTYQGYKPKDSCTTNCNKSYYTFYCTESIKVYASYKTATTYSCPSGYTKSGSGTATKCTKKVTSTSTKTANATVKSYTYSCPSGYTKSGTGSSTSCTKKTTSYVTAKITYNYTCPSGYVKNGTTCKANDKVINAKVNKQYSCPTGYYKVGTGDKTICVKNSTSSINASKKTNEVVNYRYKWSRATELAGWARTGRTRTVSSK